MRLSTMQSYFIVVMQDIHGIDNLWKLAGLLPLTSQAPSRHLPASENFCPWRHWGFVLAPVPSHPLAHRLPRSAIVARTHLSRNLSLLARLPSIAYAHVTFRFHRLPRQVPSDDDASQPQRRPHSMVPESRIRAGKKKPATERAESIFLEENRGDRCIMRLWPPEIHFIVVMRDIQQSDN
jgi:hypothetical protein